MEKKNFEVSVSACNAETFKGNYTKYINTEVVGYYDNTIFSMSAPEAVYNEIADLQDECIEILEPKARKVGAIDCFMPEWDGFKEVVDSNDMAKVVAYLWENKCVNSDSFYTIDEDAFNRDYLEDGEVILENDRYLLTYDDFLYESLFLYEKE